MGGTDTPPLCKCHGVPKHGKQCAVKHRATNERYMKSEKGREGASRRAKSRKARLREAGLCTNCAKRPLAQSDSWHCNECMDKKITPEKLLQARRGKALTRKQQREANRGTVSQQE